MNPCHWLAGCTLAATLFVPPVAAQTPAVPQGPSTIGSAQPVSADPLATAFEAAWQRALAAREAAAQRNRAGADRAAANAWWAAPPALEVGHRAERWPGLNGARETEVALAWPLLLPGQRSARVAGAEAALALADEAFAAARWHVAGEVREAAWAWVAEQAEVATAEAHAQALARLSADVDRRVAAGDLARADALAARADWLAARSVHAEAGQRLQLAASRWTLLTGLPEPPRELAPPVGPAARVVSADTVSAAHPALLDKHPALRLASATTALARQRLALERLTRREAPQILVGLRQDSPGRGEGGQTSLAVGLRWAFGTDDRNRPLEAAALGELDLAQATEQRLRERLAAEHGSALLALAAAERQWQAEHERAALLHERAALIERSFAAGETALPDLLRARAAAAQAASAFTRQHNARGLALARVRQALGLLP